MFPVMVSLIEQFKKMSQYKNNVFNFPNLKNKEILNLEEFKKNFQIYKNSEIDEITELLFLELIHIMNKCGIEQTQKYLKNYCFLFECIKSVISRHYEIQHPFHDFAENIFIINDRGEVEFLFPEFRQLMEADENANT